MVLHLTIFPSSKNLTKTLKKIFVDTDRRHLWLAIIIHRRTRFKKEVTWAMLLYVFTLSSSNSCSSFGSRNRSMGAWTVDNTVLWTKLRSRLTELIKRLGKNNVQIKIYQFSNTARHRVPQTNLVFFCLCLQTLDENPIFLSIRCNLKKFSGYLFPLLLYWFSIVQARITENLYSTLQYYRYSTYRLNSLMETLQVLKILQTVNSI